MAVLGFDYLMNCSGTYFINTIFGKRLRERNILKLEKVESFSQCLKSDDFHTSTFAIIDWASQIHHFVSFQMVYDTL